ncbi:MAG TPA: RNA-directed DNA polymerase [Edaphobacter sp.]|nr:RNA-directed DNA polymerase [Edaphobacter sp.]
MAADEMASSWSALHAFCSKSPLSLSIPMVGTTRALVHQNDLGQLPFFRAQRCVGSRYLLKTDIARFYPSIYTHSIPWALHGKTAARSDKKYSLIGNRLDLWTRETQDKQTGGIPIGPDTSFLLGEIIATALDLELLKKLPQLRGIRSVDDYFLYFNSISDAENALAVLHGIARQFELEINDPKTEIIQLPDTLEPPWKSELRKLSIRPQGRPQATDLLSLFDRAFDHAKLFPPDSVLTYVARQVLSASITEENWPLCEALLLKAALNEPTMLSVLVRIYDRFSSYSTDTGPLTETLQSICFYHAPLQQGNEVAWALYLADKMNITISRTVGDKIARVDDDVVALVALDLMEQGRLNTTNINLWKSFANATNLYEHHWLLAYEAHMHGWLSTHQKPDYVCG